MDKNQRHCTYLMQQFGMSVKMKETTGVLCKVHRMAQLRKPTAADHRGIVRAVNENPKTSMRSPKLSTEQW